MSCCDEEYPHILKTSLRCTTQHSDKYDSHADFPSYIANIDHLRSQRIKEYTSINILSHKPSSQYTSIPPSSPKPSSQHVRSGRTSKSPLLVLPSFLFDSLNVLILFPPALHGFRRTPLRYPPPQISQSSETLQGSATEVSAVWRDGRQW